MPEGWAWCRLGEVCELKGGKRIPAGLSATKEKTNHIYIRVTDMQNNSISDADLVYITDEIFEKIQRYTINKDDLYLTIAGTIGRVGEVPEIFDGMNLTENALKLTNISICKKYLMQIINTKLVQDYFESTYHQVAMPKLSLINASKTIMPLPPLAEQERIVSVIKSIFSQIDTLDQNKSDLQTAIKQTKSKILDLAIHGTLVPQDPKDEPAEELLKRIATSDNRPYKKFEEDEVPFIIPFNWKWERLAKISSIISKGTTPRGGKNAYCIEGINYLRVENISADGTINLEDINHISENEHLTFLKRSILQENDVIISIAGTLGKIGIIRKCDLPMNTNQAIAFVRISNLSIINLKYLRYVLESVELQRLLLSQTKVTSIPNLTLEIINNCPIPLPPIQEQNRIVSKIEELFSYLDTLSSNLE